MKLESRVIVEHQSVAAQQVTPLAAQEMTLMVPGGTTTCLGCTCTSCCCSAAASEQGVTLEVLH